MVRAEAKLNVSLVVSVKHVLQNMYRLHAIILSRSPFLAHLMSTSPQSGGQRTIYVHLEHEPEVTHEVSQFPTRVHFQLNLVLRVAIGICNRRVPSFLRAHRIVLDKKKTL